MKKYFMTVAVLLVAVVTLTGCGSSKTLTCTSENTEEKISEEVKVKYNGKDFSSMTSVSTFDAGDEATANSAKSLYDSLYGTSYGEMEGVDYSSEVKGTKFIMTLKVDASKLTEENKKELLESEDATYDGMKKYFTDAGYSCK